VEQVYRALVRGLEAAHARAVRRHKRARDLAVLVREVRESRPAGIVRCAWCGKIAAEKHWFDPTPLLEPVLLQRLEHLATHGICPRCFERTQSEADRTRSSL